MRSKLAGCIYGDPLEAVNFDAPKWIDSEKRLITVRIIRGRGSLPCHHRLWDPRQFSSVSGLEIA